MKFEKSIIIDNYTQSAYEIFNSWQNRLVEIQNTVNTRTNGKTVGSMLAEMVGTIVWTVVSAFFFSVVCAYNEVAPVLNWVTPAVTLLLLVIILMEEFLSLFYCGKIQKYQHNIKVMIDRISIGKQSFNMKKEDLLTAKQRGWECTLKSGESIPDKAIKMETLIDNLETISGTYLATFKNVLFFSDVVLVALLGSIPLFGAAGDLGFSMITTLLDKPVHSSSSSFEDFPMTAVLGVCMFLACGIGVFIAKVIWGKADCNVNNISFTAIALGPVLFILLIIVAIGIFALFMWAIAAVVCIGALALLVACLCCTSNGG